MHVRDFAVAVVVGLVLAAVLYASVATAIFPYRNPKANRAATLLYMRSALLFRRVDAFQP